MKNNLTKKEINNLYNWAKEYGIKELQIKDRKKLLNIKELKLGNEYYAEKGFSYIPNEIFKLINLESLYIDCHDLEEIPNDIGNLVNLKNLTIEDISFEKLPDGISTQWVKTHCYKKWIASGLKPLTQLCASLAKVGSLLVRR